MGSDGRPPERLIFLLRDVTGHDHQTVQHLVDDLAHAAKECIGISGRQHIMKVDVLVSLAKRMLMTRDKRLAHLHTALQRVQLRVRQILHRASRK